METIIDAQRPNRLFNSHLETGTRALIILDAAYPRTMDLTRLTWFDHLVVHTEDIGGPQSLHPPLSSRTGELLVMRTKYSLALKERASWLIAELAGLSDRDLTQRMNTRIDRWATEFQGEAGSPVSRL